MKCQEVAIGSTQSLEGDRPSSLRICFVAQQAYNVLVDDPNLEHIGGAEVQQKHLAFGLAARGHEVSFITLDHGQEDGASIHGIKIFTSYDPKAGLRGVRFFHPRLTGLWAAMRRADAQVYYQRGAEVQTGLVALGCARLRRKFVFALAHDTNCDPKLPALGTVVERFLYRKGLRRADAIVAQTQDQQKLLRRGFGLDSRIVRSCCPAVPDPTPKSSAVENDKARILWVGRLSQEKRPEWVLKLAHDLPMCNFDVVGQQNQNSSYGAQIADQLRSHENISWYPYVRHHEMESLYRSADVVLSTSDAEGFPNVFLEAWSFARPVISCLDPDGIIERERLGWVEPTYDRIKQRLRSNGTDKQSIRILGNNARTYVSQAHNVDTCAHALEKILAEVVTHS